MTEKQKCSSCGAVTSINRTGRCRQCRVEKCKCGRTFIQTSSVDCCSGCITKKNWAKRYGTYKTTGLEPWGI